MAWGHGRGQVPGGGKHRCLRPRGAGTLGRDLGWGYVDHSQTRSTSGVAAAQAENLRRAPGEAREAGSHLCFCQDKDLGRYPTGHPQPRVVWVRGET